MLKPFRRHLCVPFPIWMTSTRELHRVLKKLRRRKSQQCYQSLLMCLLLLPMAWGGQASSNMRSKQMKVSLSSSQRAVAKAEIQNMVKHGVIELSSSPRASPIVVLCKKDGTTRCCVDYCRLNFATVKDSYPLPRLDDSINASSSLCWLSRRDLASAYWKSRKMINSRRHSPQELAFTSSL